MELALLNQYIENRLTNETDETKEKCLERVSKKFLSTVKPGDRFAQGVDFYGDIVRISQDFDEHEDFYKMVKTGINSLEKYGLNLWRFPWRKEYHTVKLYTAFFKCNIEKQLKDKDFILSVLKFLGYTERDEQKVSMKDSERRNSIWASFNLYLLQVELQLIEEIQSQILSRNIPLEEIVEVRLKMRTVEEAIYYLDKKIAPKRQKLELSKATASGAADAINRSNEPTVGKRYIPVAELPHHKVPPGGVDSGQVTDNDLYGVGPRGSQPELTTAYNCDARDPTSVGSCYPGRCDDASLSVPRREKLSDSQHAAKPPTDRPPCSPDAKAGQQHVVDSRYLTFPDDARMTVTRREKTSDSQYAAKPPTGRPHFSTSAKGGQQHGVDSLYNRSTFPRLSSSHYHGNTKDEIRDPKKQPALLSNGHSFSCLTGAGPSAHGVDTRYVNLGDTNGWYSQNITSSGFDQSLRTKEGERHFEGKLPAIQQTASSCTPRGSNGMENGTHASSAYQLPGNDEPSHVSKTTKASQQQRNISSEHKRRQTKVEYIPSATEAATSRQTHRSYRDIESPVASGITAVYNINYGETEGRSHLLEKPSSPVQPRTQTRNSTQKEDSSARHFPALKVQNPPQGSLEVFQTGAVPVARTASSHEACAAKQSSKVENSMCDFCAVQATSICRFCCKLACGKCKEIDFTCKATKREHQFVNLNVLKGKSEQGLEISREDWSCLRCTFLNPPEKKICDMCATTRGLGAVELSKPGSRVCRSCTCHNNENAKNCHACSRTLDPNCRETAI